MRFRTALTLLLVSAATATEDTCQAFQEAGECFDLENSYVDGGALNRTRAVVEGSGSSTATSVYDQFMEPVIDMAMGVALFDLELPAFCYGNYKAEQLQDNQDMDGLGCDAIPLQPDLEYGILAGHISIPTFLQQALHPLSLVDDEMPVQEETITSIFCLGLLLPNGSCGKLTFGATVNRGAVAALKEEMPSGGVGEAILAWTSALVDGGNDPATVAFTLGGGLDVSAHYYINRKLVKEDFHAHLAFSSQGPIQLPFVAEDLKDSIVQIEGPYQRAFNLGKTTSSVEATLTSLLDSTKMTDAMTTSEIAAYVESVVETHPEVISTKGNLTIELKELTGGLIEGLTIDDEAEIRALKLPSRVGDVPAGFYMHVHMPVDALIGGVKSICNHFEGVLLTVAGVGCPNLEGADDKEEKGTLALEIRKEELELLIEWSGFFLRCKTWDMESDSPRINCQMEDIVFGISTVKNGYAIGKVHALTGHIEEQVAEISKDEVELANGFGRAVVVTSKLSSDVTTESFKSVAKFFEGDAAVSRTAVDFGFQEKYRCKNNPHRLWNSLTKDKYKHHFSQAGNDASRASCFESCYEWYEANPDHNPSDLCCSYEELHDLKYAECRVGHKGREGASDHRKSATITFVEDYQRLQSLPVAGARCEKGEDCFSGFCHEKKCKHQCSVDNKCFPSQWSKCFGKGDACLDVNGANHYCDQGTDSCVCDAETGPCKRHMHKETVLGLMKPTRDDKTSDSE